MSQHAARRRDLLPFRLDFHLDAADVREAPQVGFVRQEEDVQAATAGFVDDQTLPADIEIVGNLPEDRL